MTRLAALPRLSVLMLGLTVATCSGGCKKTAPAPTVQVLRPAEEHRARLLVRVTLAPPARTASKIEVLAKKLGLPFSGQDALAMVAAQQGISPESLAHLDTARPLGFVMVGGAQGAPPWQALAATARSPEAAQAFIAALGAADEPAETKGRQRPSEALLEVKRPDGRTAWWLSRGAALVAGDSAEAVRAAGALAIDAQRETSEDMVMTVHADALARWQGTDVGGTVNLLRSQTLAAMKERPGLTTAELVTSEAILDLLLARLVDTATAEMTLGIDAERGLRLALKLGPRPGSVFAQRLRARHPYTFDPSLVHAGATVAAWWANGPSPFWLEIFDAVTAAQTKAQTAGAPEIEKHWRALRPNLSGAAAGGMYLRGNAVVHDLLFPLAKGASPSDALATIGALVASRDLRELVRAHYGTQAPEVRSKKSGGTWRTEVAFPVRDRQGNIGRALEAMTGSATLSTHVTAARGHILAATDPDAPARLAALVEGSRAALPADLASAVESTRGADGFVYFDIWAGMRPALAAMNVDPRQAQMLALISALPGLSQLKLPLVMAYRGGDSLDAELRVPLVTLENAAGVLRPFLGMGTVPANP